MKVEHLRHKFGGKIVELLGATHSTHNGVASWYYRGRVLWDDGKAPRDMAIAPYHIYFAQHDAEAKREYDAISDVMATHLETNGYWHDAKHKRDGRVYFWTPFKPEGETLLPMP